MAYKTVQCANVDIWSKDERRSSWRNGRGIRESREGGGNMSEEICGEMCEKIGEKICEIGKTVRRWVRRWVRREVKTRGNWSFIEYIALGKA